MSMDDHGQPMGWPTLTEAAARTGYTREALRQRIRRGKLKAVKSNADGQLRLDPQALADLPPPDAGQEEGADDRGRTGDDVREVALDVLQATVADLRSTVNNLGQQLDQARSALDTAQAERLVDRGRAERAEAQATAEAARAAAAEAREKAAEAALAEARTPLVLRVIKAMRRRG